MSDLTSALPGWEPTDDEPGDEWPADVLDLTDNPAWEPEPYDADEWEAHDEWERPPPPPPYESPILCGTCHPGCHPNTNATEYRCNLLAVENERLRGALAAIARVPLRPLQAQSIALGAIVDEIDRSNSWRDNDNVD